jgi:UDP-apiose/xylose synthase
MAQNNQLAVSKIAIIGCGGFVGSHLLDALFHCPGLEVVGWDPDDTKIKNHIGRSGFSYKRTSLRGREAWNEIERDIENTDVVINLAAICRPFEYNNDPITVIRSNFIDSYHLVEICADRNKWLMHFSTSEVYGRTIASYLPDNEYGDPDLYELNEDQTPLIMGPIKNQRWTYACAKQLFERYIFAHGMKLNMPFTIVRPLNFFGPKMDFIPGEEGEGVPRVLASYMAGLLHGKPLLLVDGGHARRTIVSIHDAVKAILLMLEKPDKAKNQIFNVGNRENEVTMWELAHLMRKIYAGVSGDASYNNHAIQSVSSEEYYGKGYEDCDRRMPSVRQVYQLLGWTPEISLEDTLKETIEYYFGLYGKPAFKGMEALEPHMVA